MKKGMAGPAGLAILAAVFYALNAPFSKLLLRDVDPSAMASLLYLGAGVGMALLLAIKSGLKAPLLALLGHEGLAGGVRYFLLVLVAGAVWPLAFRPMSKWGKRKK